jgi:hypothetical protein
MTIKKEQPEAHTSAVPGGSQTQRADEESKSPWWRPEDLNDIVTIEASARASELRVDECTTSAEQGESKVRRTGLPPAGAEPGITYRNVQVSIEVKGRTATKHPTTPSPRPGRAPSARPVGCA